MSEALTVAHIIGGDLNGGAAKGALNVHIGLLELGVSSYVISEDPKILKIQKSADPSGVNRRVVSVCGLLPFLLTSPWGFPSTP